MHIEPTSESDENSTSMEQVEMENELEQLSGAVSASTSPLEGCTSPLSIACDDFMSDMPVRSSPVTDFESQNNFKELFGEAALFNSDVTQNDDLFLYQCYADLNNAQHRNHHAVNRQQQQPTTNSYPIMYGTALDYGNSFMPIINNGFYLY